MVLISQPWAARIRDKMHGWDFQDFYPNTSYLQTQCQKICWTDCLKSLNMEHPHLKCGNSPAFCIHTASQWFLCSRSTTWSSTASKGSNFTRPWTHVSGRRKLALIWEVGESGGSRIKSSQSPTPVTWVWGSWRSYLAWVCAVGMDNMKVWRELLPCWQDPKDLLLQGGCLSYHPKTVSPHFAWTPDYPAENSVIEALLLASAEFVFTTNMSLGVGSWFILVNEPLTIHTALAAPIDHKAGRAQQCLH